MRQNVFAIYDKKAQFHLNPFFMVQKGEALRTLDDLVNDTQSRLNKHTADYSLWRIGEFDTVTGILFPLSKPEFLEEASTYVKKGA